MKKSHFELPKSPLDDLMEELKKKLKPIQEKLDRNLATSSRVSI